MWRSDDEDVLSRANKSLQLPKCTSLSILLRGISPTLSVLDESAAPPLHPSTGEIEIGSCGVRVVEPEAEFLSRERVVRAKQPRLASRETSRCGADNGRGLCVVACWRRSGDVRVLLDVVAAAAVDEASQKSC